MDKQLESFFGAAKKICLTQAERKAAWKALAVSKPNSVRHTKQSTEAPIMSAASTIGLTASEKESAFARIRTFMDMHPVQSAKREERSSWFLSPFFLRTLPASMVVIAILVTSGGGLAYAAEDTVPGDLLYPLKTEVTEPLRERWIRDHAAHAQFQIDRLQHRLTEAEELLMRGALTNEQRVGLELRMEKHVARLQGKMEHLENQEGEAAADIIEQFEALIESHESVLETLTEGIDPEQKQQLLVRLQNMEQQNRHVRDRIFKKKAKEISPERLRQRLNKAAERLDNIEGSEDAKAEVQNALKLLDEGKLEEAWTAAHSARKAGIRHGKMRGFEQRFGMQLPPGTKRGAFKKRSRQRPPPEFLRELPTDGQAPLRVRDGFTEQERVERQLHRGQRRDRLEPPREVQLKRRPVPNPDRGRGRR